MRSSTAVLSVAPSRIGESTHANTQGNGPGRPSRTTDSNRWRSGRRPRPPSGRGSSPGCCTRLKATAITSEDLTCGTGGGGGGSSGFGITMCGVEPSVGFGSAGLADPTAGAPRAIAAVTARSMGSKDLIRPVIFNRLSVCELCARLGQRRAARVRAIGRPPWIEPRGSICAGRRHRCSGRPSWPFPRWSPTQTTPWRPIGSRRSSFRAPRASMSLNALTVPGPT